MKIRKTQCGDCEELVLTNGAGMELTLCSLGASIKNINVPDRNGKSRSVTLTPASQADFRNGYYGKTIGRTAGRIADAYFEIDGKSAVLEKNNHAQDNLHGGSTGFHSVVFSCKTAESGEYTDVKFFYESPNGEGGYFGNVDVKITYRVFECENKFVILFDGRSDVKTLLNLTNHVYLNMSGDLREKVTEQTLFINARHYGELDSRLIVRKILPVTPEMDFTVPHKIGDFITSDRVQRHTCGYDHQYFLRECGMEQIACSLKSELSGIELQIRTTYPCVVFYSNGCPNSGMALSGGGTDEKYLAACLECQYHPDGIHQTPDNCGVLSPEKPYHEEIEYKFNTVA